MEPATIDSDLLLEVDADAAEAAEGSTTYDDLARCHVEVRDLATRLKQLNPSVYEVKALATMHIASGFCDCFAGYLDSHTDGPLTLDIAAACNPRALRVKGGTLWHRWWCSRFFASARAASVDAPAPPC